MNALYFHPTLRQYGEWRDLPTACPGRFEEETEQNDNENEQ